MVVNDLWYEISDFSHIEYMSESLSDHTPLVLIFPNSPKQTQTDKKRASRVPHIPTALQVLNLKKPLKKLNKDKFRDIHNQWKRKTSVDTKETTHGSPEYRATEGKRRVQNHLSQHHNVIVVPDETIVVAQGSCLQNLDKESSNYVYSINNEKRDKVEVARKKDLLWVRQTHRRYLKNTSWWEFKSTVDAYWYLKKLCKVKEQFKWGSKPNIKWH
ncbi:LOW QUALITY PROTEIN: hypothetical protein Cgig2_018385 [Carnegiea gigantea]|uniref:Uncharacterized protein n=1 Tax=Carnegiea gigantea TaxID=171969 RepID=A0A9Q1GWM8_9CARY|nr:LOW QUALITY PROTEIN: hypothetical protein Cgig2_018385 [Carnegiea gigantea]